MFAVPNPLQNVGLGLVATATVLFVVSCLVIIWLIRQTNIAADVQVPPADEEDLFAD
jgi:hypothetical protein